MKRILVIANNFNQASYRLRIDALVPLLKERGIQLEPLLRPRAILARRKLLATAGDYDAVILQRKLLDPGDARLLRKHAKKIFYDIDDAVMIDEHHIGLVARLRTRRRFAATSKIIDHAVTGNEHLAGIFRDLGKSVTVLPTPVDPGHYTPKVHVATDAPTLVWIGSRSTLAYVKEHLPYLEAARVQLPGLRLIIVADQTLQSATLPIEFVPWSVETESAALARGDIGIAPTPDTPWTRGKSGFKIIQYMASGLPTIASPVGANRDLVEANKTGLLATTGEEWIGAIVALAKDADLRARLGAEARQRVEVRYSLRHIADEWAKLLNLAG